MSRNLILTLIIVISATLTAGLGALYDLYRPAPGETVTIAISKSVPDFGVTTLEGKTVHINDLRGKIVIINFWATWCAPCVVEFPTLIKLVHQYKGDVILLALSSDRDTNEVAKFIKTQRTHMGTAYDSEHILVAMDNNRNLTRDLFRVTTYPESLIIAPDGTIVRHIIGIDAWNNPETTEQIENLISFKSSVIPEATSELSGIH